MNNTILIPYSFNVLGRTIEVDIEDCLTCETGKLGTVDYDNGKIKLQRPSLEACIKQQTVEQAFYHEVVHVILDAMHERKLSTDEKFVDLFSALLHQIMVTSNFE